MPTKSQGEQISSSSVVKFSDFIKSFSSRLVTKDCCDKGSAQSKNDSIREDAQVDTTKIKINEKYINCVLREVDFMNKKMHIYLFIDITQV